MSLSEKAKENKRNYNIEYAKKNYKRIPLDVQRSKYDEISQAAENVGESVNGYIKKAIDTRLESGEQLDFIVKMVYTCATNEIHCIYKPYLTEKNPPISLDGFSHVCFSTSSAYLP